MTTVLLLLMMTSGLVMSLAILLMAPKGGLGFGLGGMGGSNEYGTKKSIESSLKRVATIGAVLFVITSLIYPFTKPMKNINNTTGTGSTAPSFDLGNNKDTGTGSILTGTTETGN